MDLVRRVDGVWLPNLDNLFVGDREAGGGEEARASSDCSLHPSDRLGGRWLDSGHAHGRRMNSK